MSHAPIFSIITITSNNRAGLERTYHSILTQTLKDFEWVVIDGASSDGTLEFLQTETNQIPAKTIVSEPDLGIYDAMNKGIKRAKGAYLLFLNAGDKMAGQRVLEELLTATKKEPDFMYGDSLEGVPPVLKAARRAKDIKWGMFTHHQAMVYSRKVITAQELRYSILYEIAGDYDFTARFLRVSKSVVYLPKPLCIFETGGVSQKNAVLGRREQFMIREALKIVGPIENVWIYAAQAAAWRIKALSPPLYRWIKKIAS